MESKTDTSEDRLNKGHCEYCGKAFTEGQRVCLDNESGLAFCSTRCALVYFGAPAAKLPQG